MQHAEDFGKHAIQALINADDYNLITICSDEADMTSSLRVRSLACEERPVHPGELQHRSTLNARMDRRTFLCLAPALLWTPGSPAATNARLRRRLPRGDESLPVVGMGTWLTFDVTDDYGAIQRRRAVLQRFFAAGGGMIDSSPMYGQAEWLLGQLLPEVPHAGRLFAATKIWTAFDSAGPRQLDDSLQLWGQARLDAVLVHNLLNWRAHLRTLRQARDAGRVRYIGISTSHGRRHDDVARLLRDEQLDLLQITYNLVDDSAEPLLQLAAERGVGVVVNRPFDGGNLFHRVAGRALPNWARDIGCADWPQFFLKWIIAHPAVTCAIPATSNPVHMEQNMAAGLGLLPDPAARNRMRAYLRRL